MSSKGNCFVLLLVLGVTVMPGCRTNKSAFTYATPPRPTTTYASTGPTADTLPALAPPASADANYSSPADATVTPSGYSPAPSKSSAGCTSGCCSG